MNYSNNNYPSIHKSADFMNSIYKTYDKQVMPTLPNYFSSKEYPRPISRGNYLINNYNERNDLLLQIRQQNVGLKYMLAQIKDQHEKEKQDIYKEMAKMREEIINTNKTLSTQTEMLNKVSVQLKYLMRPRIVRKKDHWKKTIKSFIHIYRCYKYSLELAWNRDVKDRVMRLREINFDLEMNKLRKWMFGIQKEFFLELEQNRNKVINFFTHKNFEESKFEEYKNEEYFQFFLKLFLKTLIKNCTEISEILIHIQELIYQYIRDGIYFKKNFLSTFEINRLKFNFFGETTDNTKSARAMLLCFLVISKAFIHNGLLKMNDDDVFDEFYLSDEQKKFLKIFASLLHFITRESFRNKPVMFRNRNNLANYYRNYKIYNPDIEEEITDFITDLNFTDIDEYYHDMIDEDLVFAYFRRHRKFMENYKESLYNWAVLLANHLKRRFGKRPKESLRYKEDKDED